MTISSEYFTGARSWRALRRAVFILSLVLLQTANVLLAQAESSQPPQTTTTPLVVNEKIAEDLQRLTDRVLQLEIDLANISKATPGSLGSNVTTAIIAGFASLGAAVLTLIGQSLMGKREARRALELARQEALLNHTEKILEFRLKQIELFYAPLFALLEQSKALYDKMLHQLAHDEPQRYKLLLEPDPEGYRMQVCAPDGTGKGFRLLDQFPAVRTNPRAFALAERILQIGEQTTKIISDHAGLASSDLIDLLGEYLAHHAVLSTIYKLNETVPYEPGWHKMLYYPRQLNEKIEEDYRELNQSLDEYAKAGKSMLKTLPAVDHT